MNIILFKEEELLKGVPKEDFRIQHLLTVLKKDINEPFSAGIINGKTGEAKLSSIGSICTFSFSPLQEKESPSPIVMICGIPRPPVARRILKDCATAAISQLHFIGVENSEKSYTQSKLWKSGDWKLALLEGAQQGKISFFPQIYLWNSVVEFFKNYQPIGDKILLDNVCATQPLAAHLINHKKSSNTVIAVGAERGWTDLERRNFITHGFQTFSLGKRIYRTEVALSSAIVMTQNIKEI